LGRDPPEFGVTSEGRGDTKEGGGKNLGKNGGRPREEGGDEQASAGEHSYAYTSRINASKTHNNHNYEKREKGGDGREGVEVNVLSGRPEEKDKILPHQGKTKLKRDAGN